MVESSGHAIFHNEQIDLRYCVLRIKFPKMEVISLVGKAWAKHLECAWFICPSLCVRFTVSPEKLLQAS